MGRRHPHVRRQGGLAYSDELSAVIPGPERSEGARNPNSLSVVIDSGLAPPISCLPEIGALSSPSRLKPTWVARPGMTAARCARLSQQHQFSRMPALVMTS